jgi:GT2 family glycosyltransferase
MTALGGSPLGRRPPIGSIVVSTRDRAARVADTVERLIELPDRWPVIVVDDASNDDTTERLRRRFGDSIRLIRLDRNRGAAARTVGVRAADTDLVAFADDDSWWEPGALTHAATVLHHHPDVALVAATVMVEPAGQPDPIVDQFRSSALPRLPAGRSVIGFLACAAVVRRSSYLEVGGFHRLLHVGGEEQLLAIDLRASGWQLVHVPDVIAHHSPEAGDAGRAGRSSTMLRNQVLIDAMRRPRPVAVRTLRSLARAARRDAVARRALVGALARLPVALAARRTVPGPVEAELRLVGL